MLKTEVNSYYGLEIKGFVSLITVENMFFFCCCERSILILLGIRDYVG